jgi:hypothetical protein
VPVCLCALQQERSFTRSRLASALHCIAPALFPQAFHTQPEKGGTATVPFTFCPRCTNPNSPLNQLFASSGLGSRPLHPLLLPLAARTVPRAHPRSHVVYKHNHHPPPLTLVTATAPSTSFHILSFHSFACGGAADRILTTSN